MNRDTDCSGALLDVARSTATQRDLPALLLELVTSLRRCASFDRLSLVLHDPVRDVMRLHSVAAFHPTSRSVEEMPVDDTPAGVAWRTQKPFVVPSLAAESRFPVVTEILRGEGMASYCALPLTSPLRRLGALVFASEEEDAFDPASLSFLEQLTGQVALAVDNTLHHEDAERAQQALSRERNQLRLLLEANNTLVSNLDLRTLFAAIIVTLRKLVPHEYTSLTVYDEEKDAFELRALEFAGKGLVTERMLFPPNATPAGITFAAGEPRRFSRADLEQMSHEFVKLLLAEGVQSVCCVPLTVRDHRLGTLNVGRLSGEPFTDEETELLAAVANQIAFAVENSLAFQCIEALKDKLAAENVYLQEEIRTGQNFEDIVGDAPALRRVLELVETVAPTTSTVLIRGETGTGKELIARAIHDRSERRERAFVKVNCAAIPTGLLESELFGHERGAFTGAIAQRIGRFELANGGTLFLDEVGDIPIELQPKLLRVLQEQEFERLGSSRTLRVDVRVVAATNRDLEAMVEQGSFRRDLYYRLDVFPIPLPPLRERRTDIPRLVRYLTQRLARRINKRIESIPADAMTALSDYHWPGNVRELENVIERAVILTHGSVLQVPLGELRALSHAPPLPGDGTLEATEREAIVRALRESGWVIGGATGAAARLGMKRTTLQSRMRKLGIERPQP
jgi:formate hydrogenlyase transcriptional activator